MFRKTTLIAGVLLVAVATTAWVPVQDKKLAEAKARGKQLYEELCMHCHLADGKGMPGAIPPLAKSDYLKNIAKSIHAVKFGLSAPTKVNGVEYTTPMPAANIPDEEIADVMTYVLTSWGNKGKLVTAADVAKVKE